MQLLLPQDLALPSSVSPVKKKKKPKIIIDAKLMRQL